VHPLPSTAEIEAFYNKTRVVADLKEIIRESIRKFDADNRSPKKDWFNKVLISAKQYAQKEKLRVLEVGSGYGSFVHYSARMGHNVTGTEVTADYADASNSVVQGSIRYVSDGNYDSVLEDGAADLIYMEHVFEHVLHPDELIVQLKRKLSKEGILHMSVPNNHSLLARLMGSKWPWACPPDHLYFYNEKALKAYMVRHNFEVLECFSGDYYFRSIYQLYSFIPYTNLVRKMLGIKPKMYPYRYPRTLADYVTLTPYWVLWPLLQLMGPGSRNELTIIVRSK
jgi:2-polyprenyl-3-methyl-5-hydroxy-6-metoxy-1,4-benzoquinol methylase